MSVYLYDEALVSKLREITGDNRIHVIDPSEAINFLANYDKDKVKFPAVVVSRGPVGLGEYRNQVAALQGQTAKISPDNLVVKAQVVPIRISWTIEVYAVDRFTCDEIIRELVFFFITQPRFNVRVPYGLDIDQNFDVILENDIDDNSDLVEFQNRGEYFREAITVFTENAHFYSSRRHYLTSVQPPSDIEFVNT